MNRRIPSRIAATFGAALILALTGFGASAQTGDSVQFQIPPQPLSDALILFGDQSGQGVMADSVATETLNSPGYTGEAMPETALRQLLEGTGLTYRQDGDVFVIVSPASSSVAGQNTIGQRRPGIEEIIVTGQKREERIQDVPIAISAFSPEDLEAQKIEGGFDLLKGVPNVTFSKTNFSGYNFQIRGIGTQAVSATTDPGVAVSFNNTTLIVNRLFEQEYLDVERVEVLRGPQGTLFGRNATGGVINVISKKPEMGVWDGMIDVEVGNYNTRRLRGFFNAPIGDTLAIRGAYASTIRDGFGVNEAAEDVDVQRDVDDRDLWTGRLTLGWQPTDRFRANLLWERFEEDDRRVRTSKQLCHRHDNPTEIGGIELLEEPERLQTTYAQFTQGCLPGSLYSDDAYGTPNGASLPFVSGIRQAQSFAPLVDFGSGDPFSYAAGPNPFFPGNEVRDPFAGGDDPADAPCPAVVSEVSSLTYSLDPCVPDPYGGRMQSRDLRNIYSKIEPQYRASADIVEFSFDFEWTDNILFSSQTVYVKDEYWATQDYNRFTTLPIWNGDAAANACGLTDFTFFGFPVSSVDCTEPGEELVVELFPGFTIPTGVTEGGRGTFLSLTDNDGDGNIDQGGFGSVADAGYTVGADGFVLDEDGTRVGYYNHLLNEGGPNTVCDPQLGCSNTLVVQDLSRATSTQYNQEFRLVSSFDGPWNFSAGANFTRFRTINDYFVFSNAFTHVLHFWPFNEPAAATPSKTSGWCPVGSDPDEGTLCRYIDPNPLEDINGEGHNYFRSANPYELTSSAVFGEVYWNATPQLKFTLGLRMSWDQKVFTPIPSQLLLADYRDLEAISEGDPPPTASECISKNPAQCPLTGNATDGRGSPSLPDIVQEWTEPTGRFVVDWQPLLDFTDETMVYASFSRGYKGGGANPPGVAPPSGNILARASGGTTPATFEPEFVNAYEVGTKNTLFGGALVLNGTAFYYDYTDYQVSKIVDRSALNENFDAEVWGAELETVFAPSLDWQFNATIGYLQTEIANGEQSVDLMDRAQGGNQSFTGPNGETWDDWTVIKPWVTSASNCIVPTELLAANEQARKNFFQDGAPESSDSARDSSKFCPAGDPLGSRFPRPDSTPTWNAFVYDAEGERVLDSQGNPLVVEDAVVYNALVDAPNASAGFYDDLSGKELPNAPHLTVALGAQRNFQLPRNWQATARVDWYWQDESYARVYNTEFDRLKSWSNTNLSFWVTNPDNGITVEAYVKNVFDETPITGTFLNSDDSGLTTNVFTLDPRLIGVSIRKEF